MALMVTSSYRGTWYTHGWLWIGAKHQLSLTASSKEGSFYTAMSAILFAYLTHEAHINHIGLVLFPKKWAKERSFSYSRHTGKKKLTGMRAKVRYLYDEFGKPSIAVAKAYKHVLRLRRQRDQLAHGKPVTFRGSVTHDRSVRLSTLVRDPGSDITENAAKGALSSVEEVATWFHNHALIKAGTNERLVMDLGPTFSAHVWEMSSSSG